ncbi:GNAT family N-acetyltransferase [Luteimonas wenzhouensis]|uniref:N-acetyltransferase n=1 Tax=Luteimonas wenzhouensis TaxID=2599615 RepID=A0A5C5TVN0_9GAMM|nr:GNAT family N-acetyltransferase [Luteimonas wenzhouensis]TWT17352.1 N-acetyltransferase [Luteimonas wenzhouensis]
MAEVRIHSRLSQIPAAAWDALHDGANPFIAHAFLAGLEETGCLRPEWGWIPHHVALWEGDRLLAAAPAYLKDNSHGEFVFDHAWAHAHAQHGLDYYPKLLCAVPYSPVTGPRLLAPTADLRTRLARALAAEASRLGLSSAHVNFHAAEQDGAFDGDWLERADLQYHWRNEAGWSCFDDYLAAMDHKHRKNIRQERAKVARAGVSFRVVHGGEASDADLAAMHGFYLQTFAEYGNAPALTLDFLRHLASAVPARLVLVLAEHDGRPVAGALCLRGADTLYGRYWGAHVQLPGLHFETCYYQGIDYCLREGLHAFEPGAQGEHKIARGFLPAPVRSRHWIADPRFREALADWCARERAAVRQHGLWLGRRSPFRAR